MELWSPSDPSPYKLTVALDLEYNDQGIIFQALIPGYVATNMSKFKFSIAFIPTPEEFVDAALKRVGLQARTSVAITHQILYFFIATGNYLRKDGFEYVSNFFLILVHKKWK